MWFSYREMAHTRTYVAYVCVGNNINNTHSLHTHTHETHYTSGCGRQKNATIPQIYVWVVGGAHGAIICSLAGVCECADYCVCMIVIMVAHAHNNAHRFGQLEHAIKTAYQIKQ